jgi:type II secretory ATPase GspE/PulE/Tfp pilus assembly ATPase PilB-like protein
MMLLRKHGRIKGSADISARGVFEFPHDGQKVCFQVLTLKGQGGDYVTLKIHVPFSFPAELRELELSEENMCAFRTMASSKQGIVLVRLAGGMFSYDRSVS